MESNEKVIRYYTTIDGRCPYASWFDKIKDLRIRETVRMRLMRLSLGHIGDCKYIKNGLYELRIHLSPGVRIYFGYCSGEIILILSAGSKSTQQKDINRALLYWGEHKYRFKGV